LSNLHLEECNESEADQDYLALSDQVKRLNKVHDIDFK